MMDWIAEMFGEMDDHSRMIHEAGEQADRMYPRARVFARVLEAIFFGLLVGPILVVVYLALNGRCSI